LDDTALREALRELTARHESLRTCFPLIDGQVRTRPTESEAPLTIDGLEMAEAGSTGLPQQIGAWMAERTRIPFDLETGPLLRLCLLKIAAEDQVLFLNLHHLISDGWSMDLLVRELGELYASAVRRQPPRLAPLRIQYPDFAAWQRAWLQGGRLTRQFDPWNFRPTTRAPPSPATGAGT
jgi:hypothetical protein